MSEKRAELIQWLKVADASPEITKRVEAALAEARAEGFALAREKMLGIADELEDVAQELHLQTQHKSNPGSTQGVLTQQGTRVVELAARIRAMKDEG